MALGTYDAENQVITLSFPSRGGSYDFRRDGDESEFYPRGKNPGRYSYRPAAAPRRRLAHVDSRCSEHRSRCDGEIHPENRRHADGFDRGAADTRRADRAARQAGARGIFPRRASRQAAHDAIGFQERDRGAGGRGDAGRRAAQTGESGLRSHERRRVSVGPRAAEARHDARASADDVIRLLLRRQQ